MTGGLTGAHVVGEGGWTPDDNARDVAINAATAAIVALGSGGTAVESPAGSGLFVGGGGPGGGVTSVAGRSGAVVLTNTDIANLGNAATKSVGTTTGTVAAGDDSRFGTGGTGGAVVSVAGRTGAVVLANTDISGLGNSSTRNVGTTTGTVAAGNDSRFGGGASAPFIDVTASPYNATGNGTTDDTAAINAALAARAGKLEVLYFPAGTYKISAALNWKITGLVVRGDGAWLTSITQFGTNMPVVQVAGGTQVISGLTLRYDTQRAASETNSIAITFGDDTVGSCFASHFSDLLIKNAQTGMAIDPAITVVAGLFSCQFDNIRVFGYSYSAINFVGSNGLGANATGCVFNNIYTHNNASGLDTTPCAYYPVYLSGWDEVTFNQLNIEHGTCPTYDLLGLIDVGTATFNGLHFEDFTLSANNKAAIYMHTAKVVINGGTCRFNNFTGSTSNPVFRFYGATTRLTVAAWTDNGNTVTTPSRPAIDFGTATDVQAWINGMDLGQTTANAVNGGSTTHASFGGALNIGTTAGTLAAGNDSRFSGGGGGGASEVFVDLGIQTGVDPTGTTECHAAIQTALTAIAAAGQRVYARGTFKISSTVTILGNCDMADAVFNYTGTTGTALVVGSTTAATFLQSLVLPQVTATAKTITGWSQVVGSVGVKLVNLNSCANIQVARIRGFETGLLVYGQGQGISYNNIFIGYLDTNKVNLYLNSDATGWSNQNNYIGGRYGHDSAEGTNVTGVAHVAFNNAAAQGAGNNNTWLNPSLEGDVIYYVIDAAGVSNTFINSRFENTTTRVRWQSTATHNQILYGYHAQNIVQTFVSGQSLNNVWDAETPQTFVNGTGAVLENVSGGGSTNPVDVIMNAGAIEAGASPATAYGVRRSYLTTDMKGSADSYPRITLDHSNGRIYIGTGSAAATHYYDSTGYH